MGQTPLAKCTSGEEVHLDCWLSFSWKPSSRSRLVRFGEGLEVGKGELLKYTINVTGTSRVPKITIAASEGPWDVDLCHTGKLPKGVPHDLKTSASNANLQDSDGQSVLMHATAIGNSEVVTALLH